MNISISLPETALKQVTQWADDSGYPHDKFYSEALILGARVMEISAPPVFLADLSPKDLEYISKSANSSITPIAILQIITGAKSRTLFSGSEGSLTELVVSIPDDLFKQYCEHADGIGMQREKYFSLAFAMGARTSSINKQLKR